jgi:predicted PurR-regulated permease PerM
MSYRRFQIYFFITVLTVSTILTLAVFQPYFTLLAFGGVLAVLANPLQKRLVAATGSDMVSALASVFVIAFVVLVPVSYFLASLSLELISVAGGIRDVLGTTSVAQFLERVLPVAFHDQIPVVMNESVALARSLMETLSAGLFNLFSNVFGMFFSFIVVLISTYYLLKDGKRIKRELLALSPLGDEHDEAVFRRIFTAVEAVMGGMFVVGIIKGVASGIVYWIFGVPAPVFWGLMTGLASLLPLVGSSLISVPATLYLFLMGNIPGGIALGILAVLIGAIDNLLQPKLVESRTDIHPLLILLSILGGLQFYGFAGFVLGPLTLSVTIALIDIYKKEFRASIETLKV